ncbi:PPM-type phosphatase domain-containing protein [Aphelenchoides bicaudatus]|nr:PPM-type phosphatase domain-containing protein [Aphelenchoides bicaudatus]
MASVKRPADESSSSDLVSPKQPKLEKSESKNTDVVISSGVRKGERPEMQDRHAIELKLNCGVENIEQSILIGLFDGHAGFKCSEYCNQNYSKVFSTLCQKYANKNQELLEKSMKKIFLESYKTVDDGFLAEARKNKPALKDGSTGSTVFILNKTIYAAKVTITESDLFLIIGTDGLWKVFKPMEAIDYVYKKFSESNEQSLEKTFNSIADSLAAQGVLRGSGDNVSVVIVAFTENLQKLD